MCQTLEGRYPEQEVTALLSTLNSASKANVS
jgi:hypothetical protein